MDIRSFRQSACPLRRYCWCKWRQNSSPKRVCLRESPRVQDNGSRKARPCEGYAGTRDFFLSFKRPKARLCQARLLRDLTPHSSDQKYVHMSSVYIVCMYLLCLHGLVWRDKYWYKRSRSYSPAYRQTDVLLLTPNNQV